MAWIERAGFYPVNEVADGLLAQFGVTIGHSQVFIRVTYSAEQQTACWIAGHNGRSAFAALERSLTVIERQTAIATAMAVVALVTLIDEYRADAVLKELSLPLVCSPSHVACDRKTDKAKPTEFERRREDAYIVLACL